MDRPYYNVAEAASDEIYNNTGVYIEPDYLWAQMVHETGWFNSPLSQYNNFGGMKTFDEDTGLPAPEGETGWYKKYDTPEDFGRDWAKTIIADVQGLDGTPDMQTYVHALKENRYFEDDESNYLNSMLGILGGEASAITGALTTGTSAAGHTYDTDSSEEEMIQKNQPEASMLDRFANQFWSNGLNAAGRTFAINVANAESFRDMPLLNNYTPDAEDIKYVQEHLPNNVTAQSYVLNNAASKEALYSLVAAKEGDIHRQNLVDNSDVGLASIASGVGMVLDPTLLLAVVPGLGGTAIAGKAASVFSRFQKAKTALEATRVAFNKNSVLKYEAGMAYGAGGAMGDQYLAEKYGGFEADYGGAAILGALVGGLATRYWSNRISKPDAEHPAGIMMEDAINMMGTDAARMQMGLPTLNDFYMNLKSYVSQHVDTSMVKPGSSAERLINNGKLAIMPREDAMKLATKFGMKINPHAQAMTIPGKDGFSVLFKEAITPENIDGLVAHEVGVHLGLRAMMGTAQYQSLLDLVKKKITKPTTKRWKEVAKAADGDPEEALAYWAEKYFRTDRSTISRMVRDALPKSLKDSTDEQLNDLIARSIRKQMSDTIPMMKLDDGSYVVNGVYYSKDNAFNTMWDELSDRGRASQLRQSKLPKWLTAPLGLLHIDPASFEHGAFFNSRYGIAANSKLLAMHAFGDDALIDTRGLAKRNNSTTIPAEAIKDNVLQTFLVRYNDVIDARADYMNKNFGIFKKHSNAAILAVNERVVKCYDAMYGISKLSPDDFDEGIRNICTKLKAMREAVEKMGKKNGYELGGQTRVKKGLIDSKWSPDDEGFYRYVDDDKWTDFVATNFKSQQEAVDFLYKYATRAVRRNVMESRYDKMIIKEKDAFEKVNKNVEGEKPEFTPSKTLDEYIDESCKNWAYGQIDKEMSNLNWEGRKRSKGGDNLWGTFETMTSFQKRLPMDTTVECTLPNGNTFSFDADLRNFDIDMFVPQILNRSAGEIAVHTTWGNNLKQVLNVLRQDLEKNRTIVGDAVTNREWENVIDVLNMLYGSERYALNRERGLDAFGRAWRTLTYAQVGGNMTMAQLGEFGGMMAYGGLKTLLSVCPSIEKALRRSRLGENGAASIERAAAMLRAEDINTKCWDVTSSTESRWVREAMGRKSANNPVYTAVGRAGDSTVSWIKRMGMLTSSINRMSHLTDAMTNGMRRATIEDSMEWAKGKKFSKFRNPFSKKKLEAANIFDTDTGVIHAIKRDINKYLNDGNGDVAKWCDESPTTFYQWKMLIDAQTRRGIQQMTIGGSNKFKDDHPILMQFKDFSMRAINDQTLRALTSREADDALAALYSMGTNLLTYAALTEARAYAMYPEDEGKRKEFLEKQLTPGRLALAAFTRGALTGSILSVGMDAYEAFTGTPMFRTTVDNTYRNYNNNTDIDAKSMNRAFLDRLGGIAQQIPTVGTAGRIIEAIGGAYSLASGNGSTRDLDAVIRSMPIGSWVGTTYLSSYAKDELDLRKG